MAQAKEEDVMHRAIVYVVIPTNSPYDQQQIVGGMLAGIAKLEGNKSAVRLGEFVWEVNFRDDPGALAVLIHTFEQQQLSYGILPLDAATQWIRRDPPKKA
jgi:hypothetical protein